MNATYCHLRFLSLRNDERRNHKTNWYSLPQWKRLLKGFGAVALLNNNWSSRRGLRQPVRDGERADKHRKRLPTVRHNKTLSDLIIYQPSQSSSLQFIRNFPHKIHNTRIGRDRLTYPWPLNLKQCSRQCKQHWNPRHKNTKISHQLETSGETKHRIQYVLERRIYNLTTTINLKPDSEEQILQTSQDCEQ